MVIARVACSLVAIFAMMAAGVASPDAIAQATDGAPAPEAGSASAPVADPASLRDQPRYFSGTMPDRLPISRELAAQGRYGIVRASATVTPDGVLQDISLVEPSGNDDLDRAIIEALGSWKLAPARDRQGNTVSARASFPFEIGAMPARISGRAPEFPEAAKAAGHNGAVRAEATIGLDGKVSGVTITQSSGSEILDGSAAAALADWKFATPYDLKGEQAPLPLSAKFNFSQAEAGTGGYLTGLRTYRCDAFIKEIDWWMSAHPGRDMGDIEYYNFIAGIRFTVPESVIRKYSPRTMDKIAVVRGHKPAWENAIKRCRAAPGSTFLEEYRKG